MELITINPLIEKSRKDRGLPPLKKFDENSFSFIKSSEVKDDTILYRIVW